MPLPLSAALREALPESISDLFSRDVESLSDSDIDRIIEEQRANRERAERAEALGLKPPREPKPREEKASRNIKLNLNPTPVPGGLDI